MKGNLTRRGVRSWRLKYDLAPGPDGAGDPLCDLEGD